MLRQLPAVDELLNRRPLRELEERVGHRLLVEAARKVLQGLRESISEGRVAEISIEWLEKAILVEAECATAFSLQPVINATGVILHTNLGRAPLAQEAIDHMALVAAGYSNLEDDLECGERGKRDVHTGRLRATAGGGAGGGGQRQRRRGFPGSEYPGGGLEVVVSRGELIEIGEFYGVARSLIR